MRPVKAIALSVSKRLGTKVKLESGPVVILPYDKDINAGQELLIRYDFTKNCAISIINPYRANDLSETTKIIYGTLDNSHENPEEIELELSQDLDLLA